MATINKSLTGVWSGLIFAVLPGTLAYSVKLVIKTPAADPLLIALLPGIPGRSFTGNQNRFRHGLDLAPSIFIPVGIIFYGVHNLNFARFVDL